MIYDYGNERVNKFVYTNLNSNKNIDRILCIYCSNTSSVIYLCYLNKNGELRKDYYAAKFFINHIYICPKIKIEKCDVKILSSDIFSISKLFIDKDKSLLYLTDNNVPFLAADGTYILDYTNKNFDILDQI